MARRVSKRYKTRFTIALSQVRPDLRWAEALLGQSIPTHLAFTESAPTFNRRQRDLNPDIIPAGEHCYYSYYLSEVKGYLPCPHFSRTDYDTVKCAFMRLETETGFFKYRKAIRSLGGANQARKHGFVRGDWELEDSIKKCGVHPEEPTDLASLLATVEDYKGALRGLRYQQFIHINRYRENPPASDTQDQHLLSVAVFRSLIWEDLCSIVEPVPREVIEHIANLDALYKEHSDPCDTLLHSDLHMFAQGFAYPEKQFWYLYRTNFRRPKPGQVV